MRAVTHLRLIGAALLGAAALAACTPPPPDGDPTGSTSTTSTSSTTSPSSTTTTPTTVPVSTALGGTYSVRYGTGSTAKVHVSGQTVTITAGPNFTIEGASCTLPEHTVIAIMSGSGPRLTGSHSWFNSTTCLFGGTTGSTLDLNSDGSFSLTSSTGTHLFTKTANAVVAAPVLTSTYDTTYRSAGRVKVHASGSSLTVSVDAPFRADGSCNLPSRTVLGMYSGSGATLTGAHSWFNSNTCFFGGTVGSTLYVNADRTLTITSSTGPHLFIQRSAIPVSSGATAAGDYAVRYGTDGRVTVRASGSNYTASVSSPFSIEGATCQLPAGTVIASFSGAATPLTGSHSWFNGTTCLYGGTTGSAVQVNTDGTLTVGSSTGPHLFDRI